MATIYHYSLSLNFPNGIMLDLLQAQILQDSVIGVSCSKITLTGNDVAITFVSALNTAQKTELDNLIANYINPTSPAIVFTTNSQGVQAIQLNATGLTSGISFIAGTSGIAGSCSGPFLLNVQSLHVTSGFGQWYKAPVTVLADADQVLALSDLASKSIVVSPSMSRTYTLPSAASIVASVSGLVVGDTLDAAIRNLSVMACMLAAGSGGSITGNAAISAMSGASKIFRIIMTNVTVGSEAYAVLCFT